MKKNWLSASEGAMAYIFGICAGSMLMRLIFAFAIPSNPAVQAFLPTAITEIAFLLVVAGFVWWRRIDFVQTGKLNKFINWKQGLLLPFITIAAICVFLPLANGFVSLVFEMTGRLPVLIVPSFNTPGQFVLGVLVFAILPAFAEEFLMRGLVLNGLNTRDVWFGICITSLLFSLMHGNVLQTVHQFGLGMVLCILVVISGSIWPAVIVHFLNNFISLICSTYIPQIDQIIFDLGYWNYLTGTVSVVVGLILLVCLLYLFYRFGEGKTSSGYRVVTDGIVYDEFDIIATPEEKVSDKKYKFKHSAFVEMWQYFASLFTKQGWVETTRTLTDKMGVPYIGKRQPMLNVWLAIGFSVFYWVVDLIYLFVG